MSFQIKVPILAFHTDVCNHSRPSIFIISFFSRNYKRLELKYEQLKVFCSEQIWPI